MKQEAHSSDPQKTLLGTLHCAQKVKYFPVNSSSEIIIL